VLLDTRNREEVLHGTFVGAMSLPIDNFTELPEALAPHADALADATVVSFCTGGIRCEKAALWMQASGIERVWQLDGGILGYFEHVGSYAYEGRCFVFDERIALDTALRPLVDADGGTASPRADGSD
ncbi:MAG: rhodanese-like domain-containing protein, partial [Dokdonella sp.]